MTKKLNKEEFRMLIKNNIRAKIKDSNIPVSKIANEIKVVPKTIYRWMDPNDDIVPTIDHICALSMILNCTIQSFFD